MRIETGINPNCSEATIRLNLTRVPPNKLTELIKKLELEFDMIGHEEQTDWDDEKPKKEFEWLDTYYEIENIFDIDCLKISGDAPYNNHEEIYAVIYRYIEDPELQWTEP